MSCAALPGSLIESELFGYEKGAFTGAHALKKGRFELAEGGTLFLDEIGDVDVTTQVKLLRALQEREIERLGGTHSIRVNVRLVAATHRPLEELMAAGTFREDLFYRLNVFTIFAPPLRERKPDIMLLADHFLAKYSVEHGKHIKRIATPAIDMLTSYHWPGNVRELENTIERAVLVCEGNVIHGHHLPPTLQTAEASGTMPRTSLEDTVATFERDLIQDALKSTRGNRARAARLLQTTERILGYKVAEIRDRLRPLRRLTPCSHIAPSERRECCGWHVPIQFRLIASSAASWSARAGVCAPRHGKSGVVGPLGPARHTDCYLPGQRQRRRKMSVSRVAFWRSDDAGGQGRTVRVRDVESAGDVGVRRGARGDGRRIGGGAAADAGRIRGGDALGAGGRRARRRRQRRRTRRGRTRPRIRATRRSPRRNRQPTRAGSSTSSRAPS